MDLAQKKQKIEQLRKKIAACQRCDLHKTRTNTVPGEGDVNAKVMMIGEAPGRNEDLKGKPFVGRAGDILETLLNSIGLSREEIYLCNILKCRPPDNRNPLSTEIQACVGSLDVQIKTVEPAIIATLGNFATTYIFTKFNIPVQAISHVAGKVFVIKSPDNNGRVIKIIALFHPAVATYDPRKMDALKKDFKVIEKVLNDVNRQKDQRIVEQVNV